MLNLTLLTVYLCIFSFVLGFLPGRFEERPSLRSFGLSGDKPEKQKPSASVFSIFKRLAQLNKPLCRGDYAKKINRRLMVAHVKLTPEEFLLIKEMCFLGVLFISLSQVSAEALPFWLIMSLIAGYYMPEFWLNGKIKRVKQVIIKELPDAIDFLGLCVNAGLDFMLALKWVVEKSRPSVMINELNIVLQEINVGKTRRDAIKDLAARYELPDLSTFARTLIQADKMGTSVTEALNILSEDMRMARFRRGEQIALKAPIKMLLPLLFFIFPCVFLLVAGPIMIDFIENNPFSGLVGGR